MKTELRFTSKLEAELPFTSEQHMGMPSPDTRSFIIDPVGYGHYIPAHEIAITVAYGRISKRGK